MTYYIN